MSRAGLSPTPRTFAELPGFEPGAPVYIPSASALQHLCRCARTLCPWRPFRLPLVAIIALLAACAPLEPQRPPEQRTQVVEVKVPVPVPCFTEAERPILPPPTPIDIDNATTDQLAAALAADDANEALYAKLVDALFLQCLKSTGGTTK